MKWAGVLAGTILISAAACGDDDGGGGGDSGLTGMLDQVPADVMGADEDTNPTLYYVDMELVWERLGVAEADPDERSQQLGRLGEAEHFSFVPQLFHDRTALIDEAKAEVGFSALDVQREIAVDLPPDELRIVETTTARDDIVDALETDPTWSEDLDEAESDAGEYFTWSDGDDLSQDLERQTPMRPIGVGGQLAVDEAGDGSVVVRTKTSSLMEATLGTTEGDGGSLADEGPFSDAAEALGDGEVIQAIGTVGATQLADALGSQGTEEQVAELQAEGIFVEPYEAILLAELTDGEETRTELLVIHADEDAAAANEPNIGDFVLDGTLLSSQQPVNGIFPGAEVSQEGPVVRITTHGTGHFAGPFQALMRRDLFLVE